MRLRRCKLEEHKASLSKCVYAPAWVHGQTPPGGAGDGLSCRCRRLPGRSAGLSHWYRFGTACIETAWKSETHGTLLFLMVKPNRRLLDGPRTGLQPEGQGFETPRLHRYPSHLSCAVESTTADWYRILVPLWFRNAATRATAAPGARWSEASQRRYGRPAVDPSSAVAITGWWPIRSNS